MARTRNLKPAFFKNADLANLGFAYQVLFSGLWCIADRDGRLKDDPRWIKAEVLPYAPSRINVDKMLSELGETGDPPFIIRYEYRNRRYISIPAWKKHQNPHVKEPASTIPTPESLVQERSSHQTTMVQEQVEPCLNPSPNHLNLSLHHPSTAPAPDNSDLWAEKIYSRWHKRKDKILALQELSRILSNGFDAADFEVNFSSWEIGRASCRERV